jgi:SOS regulatory protein LexA
MATPPLTRRQRQILDFLAEYVDRHDLSPTLDEIAQAFGVNKVTIFGHISELERKGLVERTKPRVSRGLRLVPSPSQSDRSTSLPLVGQIAAGHPLEAIELGEEFDLRDLIPPSKHVYALRVCGDSMIDDGIRSGDIVLVEGKSTANNGDTVVAILENEEATLKRYYRDKKGVRLQAANPAIQPLITESVEIRGVVLGVIRRYR